MKLSIVIPLLIIVATLSFFGGKYSFNRELSRDKAFRRNRINQHADAPHKELKRVTSPDGAVDAVLAEVEIDELNPNGSAVYLVAAGQEIDLRSIHPDRKFFYATRIDSLELVWREPKFLEIRYTHGDIFEFRNNWQPIKDYNVEIRIVPQSASHSLSK